MNKTLKQEVAEVLALDEERTPGEWWSGRDGVWTTNNGVESRIGSPCISEDDEVFISHAPDMVSIIRRLAERLELSDLVYDGIDSRDETIRILEARVKELEAAR